MEHGVAAFLTDYGIDGLALARAVEERGLDALFLTEHTHIPTSPGSARPGGTDLPRSYSHTFDPFVALAAMASVTERIALGTAVSLVLQHNPVGLAKTVASVDRIANGRFELGVGSGWNREEMANHGVDPDTRTARMLEHIAALRAIWESDEAEFHGRFVDFDPIWSWPKPAGALPILIGGEGPTVLERVVAHGDGWLPFGITLEQIDALAPRIAELRGRATDAGREDITVTLYGVDMDEAKVEAAERVGVDRVLFVLPDEGADGALAALDGYVGLVG
jgi:probable F420-dependent oxidoreductase